MKKIIKRDGRSVDFNSIKIYEAMKKAFKASNTETDSQQLLLLMHQIVEQLPGDECTVEEVQDLVEQTLMRNAFYEAAKTYIIYREQRSKARDQRHKRNRVISNIVKLTDRENANVGNGPSSKLLQLAEVIGREFMETNLTDPDVLAAMRENILYAHDYSWGPIGTTTCCFIPLGKMLENGFNTGHGFIRSPKRIKAASALVAIILQSDQNDQHGGQAYGWFDRDMAPYVEKEYLWQLKDLRRSLTETGFADQMPSEETLAKVAWKKTEEETLQAMEALIHNLNTMHSRAGAQVPFCSINIGTDISRGGRLIIKKLLEAYENGLGKHEQPIFPNILWKLKSGVSVDPGDPNYDLFKMAVQVSSTRLFPSFVNQDASFNRDFPEDVPTMGCRTRVSWDVNAPAFEQTCEGRGNLSFTTLILPSMALKARHLENQAELIAKGKMLAANYKIPAKNNLESVYLALLDQYVALAVKQLMERLAYQSSFVKEDFPFLMSGVWKRSETIPAGGSVGDVLKHGTLSVGYIGLAETLFAISGQHHGESEEAQDLGLSLIRFMRTKLDEATEDYHLNFSLLATPAEGLAGKSVTRDIAIYGVIPGITDKEWYTNSFHIPVEYPISIYEKIKKEGPYHKYCNAGHISYIELDCSPKDNLPAVEKIIQTMREQDMGYMAINFPVDRCRDCQYQGYIEETCPACSSTNISHIRRITGYLADLSNFNAGKRAEEKHRVKHGRTTPNNN
ncbi:MAG TPA: anaerobic ribonucleoside-triphosphate reductase [Bacillota bacterium]|nr:anaerobic ribonucleoside-triphosphate reductase [Bacillota bacterium]